MFPSHDHTKHILDYHKKYYHKNKERIAEYKKKHREENKERIAEKKTKYYQENKERIAKEQKQYYEENKERIAKRVYEYKKNRLKNDENFRIRERLSSALSGIMRRSNIAKNNKTMTYVGCSKEELLLHLQSTKKTEWENEKLHIDHIIPCALYDHTDEDEIYKCWNWRNLRYLPEKENFSKGNKLDMNLVKQCAIEDLLPKGINYELS